MSTWSSSILYATPARTIGVVALAIGALSGGATLLTGYYNGARLKRAAEHLQTGETLAGEGQLPAAIVELRAALTLNRHDPDYALALATTLLQNDLPREAEPYLDEAIAANPTSGPANLARARAARALGSTDAATYYQRAYFGSWPIPQQDTRLEVGFEYAQFLLDHGQPDQARGMLAQLGVDAARSADALLRVANLMVRAGAARDAEPLLRDIVARRPGDEAAWAALAHVTFDRHEYAAAIDAAEHWLELQPKNTDAAQVLRVAREVRALDPTLPRLSARERARRATSLLRQSVAALDACAPADPASPDPLRVEAAGLLASPPGREAPDEDQLVDLAARVWGARQARCPAAGADNDVLGRVFAALAADEERH